MLCPRNNCKPGAVGVMLPNLEGKVSVIYLLHLIFFMLIIKYDKNNNN